MEVVLISSSRALFCVSIPCHSLTSTLYTVGILKSLVHSLYQVTLTKCQLKTFHIGGKQGKERQKLYSSAKMQIHTMAHFLDPNLLLGILTNPSFIFHFSNVVSHVSLRDIWWKMLHCTFSICMLF